MSPAHPLLARLAEELSAGGPVAWKKHRVELMLGSDREIGREHRSQERRVGITPEQVADLRALADDVHLDLDVSAIAGAGQRAGFADAHYVEAGADIVTLGELPYHDGPPDLYHALKEPSPSEALVPTPFCRLGALHSGAFHAESGLAKLLLSRDAAIFDGSNIGASGERRIPIRGRMSEFAGWIGAGWIREHLEPRGVSGPVVVVGGGRAGATAVRRLLDEAAREVTEVRLFDLPSQRARLAERFAGERVTVGALDPDLRDAPELAAALDGAVGLLLAVAVPGEGAPKIVSLDALRRRLHPRAVIVDISIDERGAIFAPAVGETWSLHRIIDHLEGQLAPRRYRAVDNMPRALPRKASPAHGEVVLPYLAALLLLSAREGGFERLVEHLAARPVDLHAPDPASVPAGRLLAALVQDLRNGLAFWPHRLKAAPTTRRLVVEDIVADRRTVLAFLFRHEVPCELSVRPHTADADDGDAAEIKKAYEYLPAPIKSCLEVAVDEGIEGRAIYHPDIDGTRSGYAALALGVKASHIVKTMILRTADGRFVAALCEGDRELDLGVIGELLGGGGVAMATPAEVREVTRHPAGGVPLVEVFRMDGIRAVLVSRGLLDHEWVVGSAGSEFVGLQIHPQALVQLGGRVEDVTR
jgi:alanine dehydrogenase/prolyl-tRNA editing enzyme YbaK/EbsC (Cys-tRNA(Pro) deacylase)